MEHITEPARITLGDRELAIVANARVLRLLKEHNLLSAVDLAAKAAGDATSAAAELGGNIGRIFWAYCQNRYNGDGPKEWPSFDWIEDHLTFDKMAEAAAAINAASSTMGNGAGRPVEPETSTSLNSGPSEPTN